MPATPLDRVRIALRDCGLGLFPVHPDTREFEVVFEVDVASAGELFRLQAKFHTYGLADRIWLTAPELERIAELFGATHEDLVDRWASPAEAAGFWAMAMTAAGRNVHRTDARDPNCPCHGCETARQYWASRPSAATAGGARQ